MSLKLERPQESTKFREMDDIIIETKEMIFLLKELLNQLDNKSPKSKYELPKTRKNSKNSGAPYDAIPVTF